MLKNIVLVAIVATAAACTANTQSDTASRNQPISCGDAEISADLKTLSLNGKEAKGSMLVSEDRHEAVLFVGEGIKAQYDVNSKLLTVSGESARRCK